MNSIRKISLVVLLCIGCFSLGAIVVIEQDKITREDVNHAQKLIGLSFTQSETDSMLQLLDDDVHGYQEMRMIDLPNNVPTAYDFNPVPLGKTFDKTQKPFKTSDYSKTVLPEDLNELAFYSIGQLAELLRTKKITSVKLTQFFLNRVKKYAPQLHCVITFTDSLAMAQAKKADKDIAAGKYLGPLQGIPFGIKDMFATKTYPTTYGSPPFRDQMIAYDASVVKKLNDAGAVMIAKLSMGELAMDDVWFGGKTRDPWDTTKGSSGSSAGPAASVSAGLLPFAIGSETLGSIVSPSTVCGTTGLRPTFGRVSRWGAMALSWTMDKVGPICRNTEDCAIVLNAIYGTDGKDQTVFDLPFNYSPLKDLQGVKVGYFKKDFDGDSLNRPFNEAAMEQLTKMGAQLVPLDLPDFPYPDMTLIIDCEAASAFESLTLNNIDDQMVQQKKYRWPNIFRAAHFIPATEYVRVNRVRYQLIQQMDAVMKQVDVCIAPAFGLNLYVTNLTGHPCVVMPNGFINEKTPTSLVFIGQLFDEGRLLEIAKQYQDATAFNVKHPPGFE